MAELFTQNAIEPLKEITAYEYLWKGQYDSFKKLSALFKTKPGSLPSDFVNYSTEMLDFAKAVREQLSRNPFSYNIHVLINGTYNYPVRLHDAKEPVELLYYTGNVELLNTRSVAVVGTRNPTEEGKKRTRNLVKRLVADGFTIMSGLAAGIDTEAHNTTLKHGGSTIAVIGTPITQAYPKENADLQQTIGKEHLLISQVPFLKYLSQDYRLNRHFFPERNKTMSALSEATIIVEAGETSGTLKQADAAIHQGRKLFILNNLFENTAINWPAKYEALGAIRVRDYSEIKMHLAE